MVDIYVVGIFLAEKLFDSGILSTGIQPFDIRKCKKWKIRTKIHGIYRHTYAKHQLSIRHID